MTASTTGSPRSRSLNERVVVAAAELTCEVGWANVTMGKLAERVGVSRQTVYNEMGSKPALAEAMVLRELATFLAAVDRAFDQHPDDLVAAIRQAVADVLAEARRNALLPAVVSSAYGAETDLLPLLTTESDALMHTAHQLVTSRLASYDLTVDSEHLDAAIDMVVRTVLSHVIHPSGSPEATAEGIAWLTGRALRP